jgi:hypothetical protein
MEWMANMRNIIMVIFYLIIPAIMIYFRLRKRIATGFALGVVFLSFILGIITVSSFEPDPLQTFYSEINHKHFQKARAVYKVLIQYGPEQLKQVKRERIVYLDEFDAMVQGIYEEYISLVKKISGEISINCDIPCRKKSEIEKSIAKLKHALTLLEYAQSIGEDKPELRKLLDEKIERGGKRLEELSRRCLKL